MDPPDIFEAVIYSRWPCPTQSGLAVGWFMSRSTVYRRMSVLTIQDDKKKMRCLQPFDSKTRRKSNIFSPFSHSGGTRKSTAVSWKQCFWKKKITLRVPIVTGLIALFFTAYYYNTTIILRSITITGNHNKKDQMLLVKTAKYVGFCVYRRSY